MPGYTKVSHMLSVTERNSTWTKPAPEDNFVVDGIKAMMVQSWPSYCRDLPVGMRVDGSRFSLLYTVDGLHDEPRVNIYI